MEGRQQTSGAETKPGARQVPLAWRLIALLVALLVTALIFAYRDRIADFASYGYLGLFVVSMAGNATVLFPVPSLAATFVAGGVLQPLPAGLVSGAGMAIGELSGYLAGYGGTAIVDPRDWQRFQQLERWMQRHGFLTIFILSVIPNPVFDLAGVAAGVLRFPLPRFLVACFLGKTIKALVFAIAGAQSLPWFDQLLR